MYLVVGATGPVGLGGTICRLLRDRGEPVRALVRPTASPSRVAELRHMGVALVEGDLKNRTSLDGACHGARAVVSTASVMVSRQAGDSVETVDENGQSSLVDAARTAGVESFVYVSFSRNIDRDFPFRNAKRAVERHLRQSGLPWTILRPTFYMEVWLSPIAEFDFRNARATIWGSGHNAISWISFHDVARFAVTSLGDDRARNAVFELGGPDALSPLNVVRIFEGVGRRQFQLRYVSEAELEAEEAAARDSFERSNAGLRRCYAAGDVVDVRETLASFPMRLTSVHDYARRVFERETE